jgi:anti-sigma B factor antagonist
MQERQLGAIRVVEVAGTLKQEHAETLRAAVARLLELGHKEIVLDLADLTDFDSAALGTLMASQIRAGKAGAVLKIANPGKRLRNLLAVTRLTDLFETHDSLDAAIASFTAATGTEGETKR